MEVVEDVKRLVEQVNRQARLIKPHLRARTLLKMLAEKKAEKAKMVSDRMEVVEDVKRTTEEMNGQACFINYTWARTLLKVQAQKKAEKKAEKAKRVREMNQKARDLQKEKGKRAHSAPREIGNCCHPDQVAARNLDLTPTGKPANPGYDRHGNPLGPGWPESFPGVQFHPTRGKVISCEKDIAGDQLRNRNAGATKLLSAPHPDTTIASLERASPFGCGTSCGGLALFFNVRRAPRFCTPITNARAHPAGPT